MRAQLVAGEILVGFDDPAFAVAQVGVCSGLSRAAGCSGFGNLLDTECGIGYGVAVGEDFGNGVFNSSGRFFGDTHRGISRDGCSRENIGNCSVHGRMLDGGVVLHGIGGDGQVGRHFGNGVFNRAFRFLGDVHRSIGYGVAVGKDLSDDVAGLRRIAGAEAARQMLLDNGITNVTASTVDIAGSMSSINDEAGDNLSISNELHSEVAKFKY